MSILREPMGIHCYHVVAELERFTIFKIVVPQERLPNFQDMLIRLWKLFGPFSLWHKYSCASNKHSSVIGCKPKQG
jgi:hypothetical protein